MADFLKGLSLPVYLAFTTTMGFFSLLYLMFFMAIPDGSKDILFAMVGAVAASWGNIVGYYFGSSAGSAAKTQLLADKPVETKVNP